MYNASKIHVYQEKSIIEKVLGQIKAPLAIHLALLWIQSPPGRIPRLWFHWHEWFLLCNLMDIQYHASQWFLQQISTLLSRSKYWMIIFSLQSSFSKTKPNQKQIMASTYSTNRHLRTIEIGNGKQILTISKKKQNSTMASGLLIHLKYFALQKSNNNNKRKMYKN